MQHTTYLNLNKPEIAVDRANIDVLNANMDILDNTVHNLEVSEADKQDKLTAGANIQINASNVISATDTTYSDFIGTDGTTAGTAGLVPAPAVTDTNKALFSDGTWKSVSTSAPVTDVEVDGTSVVNPSGVANIDLTGKQDTLTAGTNITIDSNNVISATGNTDYTELTQAEYDELTPAEKMNGTLYFITDASGDSQVVPNPQGTPTDTLNTIGINNTIYDIAGSGGGGNGNGKADLIYRAVDTSFVNITFDISKYDLYIINASDSLAQSGETYTVTREALKYYLDNSISFCGWPYRSSSTNALIQYLVTANGFEADDHTLGFVITSIYGINTGTILAPMIYSIEEREVGVWVDDKPLYQRTLIANYTSGVGSGTHVVESIADIEIVNGFGSYVESSGYIYTLPYAEGTGTSFYYYNGDVVFSIGNSVNFASGTLYLTIRYTKDSDVAGSGSYGSLGIPMEHYDDTERVVGTYFGETLYEISKMGTFSTGTFTALTLSDNIDTLVSYEASIYYPPTNQWLHIPYFEGSDKVYLITNDNLVKIVSNSTMSAYTKYVLTVKYTKSST